MPDKILYTGGPNPFKGLIGMPEPVDDCGNESTCECDKPGSHCHYVNTVESIKSNAPDIVDWTELPITGIKTANKSGLFLNDKLLVIGDIFDLPVGYEFKHETPNWIHPEITVLRIVKTEVKEETVDFSKFEGKTLFRSKVSQPEPEESQKEYDLPVAAVFQIQMIALADDEMVKKPGAAEAYRSIARHLLELFQRKK